MCHNQLLVIIIINLRKSPNYFVPMYTGVVKISCHALFHSLVKTIDSEVHAPNRKGMAHQGRYCLSCMAMT